MISQVLQDDQEASFITVESASFYGVKEKPSRVLVNSQDATFTYRDNQVKLSHVKLYHGIFSPFYTVSEIIHIRIIIICTVASVLIFWKSKNK